MNGCPAIKSMRSAKTKESWESNIRGTRPKVNHAKRVPVYVSVEQQEDMINKLKQGVSINHICNETGFGRNVLEKIISDNKIEYNKSEQMSHVGRLKINTLKLFVKGKNSRNSCIREAIKRHNIIPHEECYWCGISEWIKGPITLELDHVDGDSQNNELTNLRFLCPNCHSQTDTFRSKNFDKSKQKVSDEQLLASLKEHKTIAQALNSLNLSQRAGNYTRATKLLAEDNKYKLEQANNKDEVLQPS